MAYFRALQLFLRRPERTEFVKQRNSLRCLNEVQKGPEKIGTLQLLIQCSSEEKRISLEM